ncbi:MAG: hydrogenase, partial [Candidatus Lindowbacteria bacterium RIFCSPLOWO2_02_FULL_62_12]
MCLAIPGRIIERTGTMGRADFGGLVRAVALDLLPDAEVGDVVLIHAGFAIQT